MVTARDIVTEAYYDAGVVGQGQAANAEQATRGLQRLNWMLSQWQRQRFLVYHLIDLSIVSTGAQSYTIGPTGAIVTTYRPDRLEAAYLRQITSSQPYPIDYPLELLEAREDYANIALKSLVSFPSYMFYDPAIPNGNLFPYPVPNASIYELHVLIKEILSQFATLATAITLPNEYLAALHFNLAMRLRMAYRMPPDKQLNKMAVEALNIVRGADTQVARLHMPRDLVYPSRYNIYSDQVR